METLKIYIVHYEPLVQCRAYLESQFAKYGITNFEFITSFDRNKVPARKVNKFFSNNAHYSLVSKYITLAHLDIYNKIALGNAPMALILEDDAILCDDFAAKLTYYLSILPKTFECGFLNDGCKLHIETSKIKPNQIWYYKPATRTCCAYLLTKQFAAELLKNLVPPIPKGIDHYLNDIFKKMNAEVYWAEPTIVTDGSESVYSVSYSKSIMG
jgi:glycosyl transferase family 25